MMRRAGLVLSTALLGASAAWAEVAVRVNGDQVDVRATSAPLADVLDRLARQTGMAIVYEGPPPRQHVTVAFDGRSPTEAVLCLLEGQGLNYALVADPTGRRVATLVLSGPAGGGTIGGRSPAPRPAVARRPFPVIPGASPDAADFTPPEEQPLEDAPFAADEAGENGPDVDTPPDPAAATAGPATPAEPSPAAPPGGPVAAPGSQGQTFSASPFTPQPPTILVAPPTPPGAPAVPPAQGNPAADDTTAAP